VKPPVFNSVSSTHYLRCVGLHVARPRQIVNARVLAKTGVEAGRAASVSE